MSRRFFKRSTNSGLRGINCLRDERGSQIVEFAFSLPLIAFFLVGIFDFSGAYSVKQKLINAAREGARIGSNQPTQDFSAVPEPPTVDAVARAVGQYMQTVKLNDCGLATGGWVVTVPGTLAWTYTASGCSGNEPTVEIERGVTTQVALEAPYTAGTNMYVENTRVTVTYPYTWKFGAAAALVVPGSTFAGPSTLTAVAMMQNLN
jgi:Flp pilus assembly protein TadG